MYVRLQYYRQYRYDNNDRKILKNHKLTTIETKKMLKILKYIQTVT